MATAGMHTALLQTTLPTTAAAPWTRWSGRSEVRRA